MSSYEGYKPKFKVGHTIYGFPFVNMINHEIDMVKARIVEVIGNNAYDVDFVEGATWWPNIQDAAWIDEQFSTDPKMAYHITLNRLMARRAREIKNIEEIFDQAIVAVRNKYIEHFE